MSNSPLIETVLLSGGESRRMGENKTLLKINGEPMGIRIARLLDTAGYPVTILGEFPKDSAFRVIPDSTPHLGPLRALSEFIPSSNFVFVSACDIPLFDPRIIQVLFSKISDKDAAMPTINHQVQPLCALYRSSTFSVAKKLVEEGETRIHGWIKNMNVINVTAEELLAEGLDSRCALGANTREELNKILNDQ